MCDTWVALRDATQTRNVIFGKNSDRPIFDCQPLSFQPRRTWPSGATLPLEYVDLPQSPDTYAHLGSGPYWCWGYEEGINEYSVVIGNEAVFTRTFRAAVADQERGSHPPALGLLGMDLVRLALERSQTAVQAVATIGRLVERFGQFGSAVPTRDHAAGGYDNSFIVADPNEAWIVETVGRRWAARRIAEGACAISNELSIRTRWDSGSPDLADYAIENGWWPRDAREAFDFARAYHDERVSRQVSHIRVMRTRQLLAQCDGQVTVPWMMRIARDHYEDCFLEGPAFDAADPDFLSICMHVSAANFTWGNTASSCIATLPAAPEELPVFWWTPGPPCNGCYVPFFAHGNGLPEIVTRSGTAGNDVRLPHRAQEDSFADDSYWWLFRHLMDVVKGDPIRSMPGGYAERNRIVRTQFDELERQFSAELPGRLRAAGALRTADGQGAGRLLAEFTESCVQRVQTTLHMLLEVFEG
jgi:secernin